MARIYRYNEAIQKAFACTVKPEPWLHCAVLQYGKSGELGLDIWIWDTRQIVGSAFVQTYANKGSITEIKQALAQSQPAVDNHEKLVGKNANVLNEQLGFNAFATKQQQQQAKAEHDAMQKHKFAVELIKPKGLRNGQIIVTAVDENEAKHKAWKACGNTKKTAGWKFKGIASVKQLD